MPSNENLTNDIEPLDTPTADDKAPSAEAVETPVGSPSPAEGREPSVLDWLISVLDPRRPRLEIPPDPAASVPVAVDLSDPLAPAPAEPDVPAWIDPLPAVQSVQSPADASADVSNEVPTAQNTPAERSEPEPFPGASALPWRSLAALVIGLIGQLRFEPPRDDADLIPGLILYAVALGMLLWAAISGEWKPTRLPLHRPGQDSLRVRSVGLAVGLGSALLAFILMGRNMFGVLNVYLWIWAIIGLIYAFWVTGPGRYDGLRKLAAWVRKPQFELRLTRWNVVLILGLLIVVFFRFSSLSSVPPEMFSDHAEKLVDVQDVLDGQTHIFFPRNTGREAFQMYLTAAVIKYVGTGVSFLSLKIGTASMGVFAVIFIYLLGVELGSRRLGFFAAFLSGIAYWPNVISRVALRFTLFPAFVAPTLYFLVRGLRRGNRNDFILSGIFLGIGLHGYSPFRFVPVLVLVAFILFVLHRRKYRPLKQAAVHLGVVVAFSVIVFMPLIRYAFEDWPNNYRNLTHRMATRISDAEQPLPGPAGTIFIENTGKALVMFAWSNGDTWVHSVTHRPALDVVGAVLFYFGIVLLGIRYARHRHWEDAFLLISVPLLMMPSILSLAFPSENPSLNRTAGAIIPVFLIMAMALDGLLAGFEARMGKYWGTRLGWGVAALLLLVSMDANHRLVFEDYFEQFQASSWNTSEIGQVVRNFADTIGTENTAWVVPWPHWVDTRLVGINAGVPRRDYALSRDRLQESLGLSGTKMFILNKEDLESLDILRVMYPTGSFSLYESEVPTKDFLVFVAPSGAFSGPESEIFEETPIPAGAYPAPELEFEPEILPYPYP
jgi:4-amino-4-deoxy-L-arabinose transferase-like glycosyltransferase